MKIKTQTGIIVEMGGLSVPIRIRDIGINTDENGGGPFAVVACFDELAADDRAVCLGLYSARWMAENAIMMIPKDCFNRENKTIFEMPDELATVDAAGDLFDLPYIPADFKRVGNLNEIKKHDLDQLTADYIEETDDSWKRQNAIINAFNCGVLSFFYWLSDRGLVKRDSDVHDLLLRNCTGLFDKVTRGKI